MRIPASAIVLGLAATLVSEEASNPAPTNQNPVLVVEEEESLPGAQTLPDLQAVVLVLDEHRSQRPLPVLVVEVIAAAEGEVVEVADRLLIDVDPRWPWSDEGRVFAVRLLRPPPPATPNRWVLAAAPELRPEPEALAIESPTAASFEEQLKEMLLDGPVVGAEGSLQSGQSGQPGQPDQEDPAPSTELGSTGTTTGQAAAPVPLPLVPDVLQPTPEAEHRPDPSPLEREVPDILPPSDPATRVVLAKVDVVGMSDGLLVTQRSGRLLPGPAEILRPGDSRGDLSIHVIASDGRFAVLSGDVATLSGTLELRQTQTEAVDER